MDEGKFNHPLLLLTPTGHQLHLEEELRLRVSLSDEGPETKSRRRIGPSKRRITHLTYPDTLVSPRSKKSS